MFRTTLPVYAPAGAFCHTAAAMLTAEVPLTAAVKPVAAVVTIGSTVKAMVSVPFVNGVIVPVVIAGVKPLVHLYGIVKGIDLTAAASLGLIVPKATAAAEPENLQILWMVAVTATVCESAAEAKPEIDARATAAMIESFFMMSLFIK